MVLYTVVVEVAQMYAFVRLKELYFERVSFTVCNICLNHNN